MESIPPIPPAKQRILDLSFNAFNQKGFQAVTMDSVAKELKMSKKTIYKYFGSKEELLEAALVSLFGQVEVRLGQLQRQRGNKHQLGMFFDVLKTWKLALSNPLRDELRQALPYLHERVDTFERQILLRYLIGHLKDLRAEGMVDYPSPSREFAVAFYHLMGSLVHAHAEQAHYLLGSMVKGMATKKKKKSK